MGFTYQQIIELANRSGIPNDPTSTFRPGDITKSGNISHHARGWAVDFNGYSQDQLAEYFMSLDTLEVFHFSQATGKWYGKSKGKLVNPDTNRVLVKDHENHLHIAMSPEQVAGVGASSTSLLDSLLNPLDALNPLAPITNIVDVLKPFHTFGVNVISPTFWRRIGMGVLGAALVAAGFFYLSRRPIQQGISAVGGLAGTALQGASFGVGTGVTGFNKAAPVTAVPSRPGPKPPLAIAPTTSILPEAYAPVSPGGTYQVTTVRGVAKRPAAPLPDMGLSGGKRKNRKGTQPGVGSPLKSGPYS